MMRVSSKPFAQHDMVLVSPRYLAGSGTNNLDWTVFGLLLHGYDWPYEENRATGGVQAESPDGSVFVDFDPDRQDGVWWTIAHHDPYLKIEMSRQTPCEAIAAVLQVLPEVLLGEHRNRNWPSPTTDSVATLATNRGWTPAPTATGMTWTSPDTHCVVEHTTDPVHPWRFTHAVHHGFDTYWTATFSPQTPDVLVAQFFSHLTSDVPVTRVFGDIPLVVQNSSSASIIRSKDTAPGRYSHHAVVQAAQTQAESRKRR